MIPFSPDQHRISRNTDPATARLLKPRPAMLYSTARLPGPRSSQPRGSPARGSSAIVAAPPVPRWGRHFFGRSLRCVSFASRRASPIGATAAICQNVASACIERRGPLRQVGRVMVEKQSSERGRAAPEKDPIARLRTRELMDGRKKGKGTVAVKYRDPKNPENTWTGRGRMPRWMAAATKGNKAKKDDFLVA